MGQDDDDNMPFIPPPHFKRDELNGVNSKIMITAIASLSFVIILVIVLHIYARCLIRRQERRTAALRQLRMTTSVSIDHLILSDRSGGGLDPAVIASLPIFPFKKDITDEESQIECSVCLSLLEANEMVRKLPNCNHTFHSMCIDTWLGSQSTCPICRTEAEPKPGQLLPPESRDHPPTAPPLDGTGHQPEVADGSSGPTAKVGGSNSSSRLSSFRRILSRERSSRRVQSCVQDDGVLDLERQQ